MAFDEDDERKATRATRGKFWRDIVMVVKAVRVKLQLRVVFYSDRSC